MYACTVGVHVTTVNLLDDIPRVEVNGTSIQVFSGVIEQVTNETSGNITCNGTIS